MNRSGYHDDHDDPLQLARWRGQVASALRGKRGQRFLRDLVTALDALPEKKLIEGNLEVEGAVCALGALGKHRGVDISALDTEDWEALGSTFDIAEQLAQETMYINDQGPHRYTPEARWERVRGWAVRHIRLQESELLPP